jgi:hypothetical protein
MTSISPVPGKGAGTVAGVATVAASTGAGGAVLAQAGPNLATELAVTAAATLALWAVVYGIRSRLSKKAE